MTVHAWRESWNLVERIASDERLNVKAKLREPKYRGKNDQFLDKNKLVQSLPPDDVVLYLDADTTIHGDLAPLFDMGSRYGFAATQFNAWKTGSKMMNSRVGTLLKFSEIDRLLVETVRKPNWPSVNGGVWAAKPTSPVLPLWYEWTMAARSTFIADEKVLHMLMPKFIPTNEMAVLVGGRWNCAPEEKYQPSELRDEDVVVRHYHGDSNVRPSKSPRGVAMWGKIYRECLQENIGGVGEWGDSVGNKWMDKLKGQGWVW